MKALIGEYPWQADSVESLPDATLVSIHPTMSYEFHRRGLEYRECSDLCKHEILWAAYPEFVHTVSAVTARLDQILWEMDPRFLEIGLPIFDRLGYIIKINYDQSVYFAHLIHELKDLGVNTVACADNGGAALNEYGMFESGRSIIPEVIRAFGDDAPEMDLMIPPSYDERDPTPRFSFGQPINNEGRNGSEIQNTGSREHQVLIRSNVRKPGFPVNVLSLGCKEVDALDVEHFHRICLHKYNPDMEYSGDCEKWLYLEKFYDRASHDRRINSLLHYRGADLTGLVMHGVWFLADKLEYIFSRWRKIHAFLDRSPVDFVFFQTMAPFYLPNILVQNWCRERKVPYACWMHGGYGAYESLQGYDVTDYRLSRHHLVYGQILANLPTNPNWIVHNLGYTGILKEIHVAGSPFFEKLYNNYRKPENSRKKILFCLGNYFNHNQFYFGHNRVNSEISIWSAHKRILETLVKFQHKYDICIKDYPDSQQKDLWLKVLKDLAAEKISYISDERSFPEVLVEADLHVFSWVSTTFFQSMYTDADICLYDNTDLTMESRTLFEQNLIFNSNIERFCTLLEEYLIDGKFYLQNKNKIRELFIVPHNQARRNEQFENFILRNTATQ